MQALNVNKTGLHYPCTRRTQAFGCPQLSCYKSVQTALPLSPHQERLLSSGLASTTATSAAGESTPMPRKKHSTEHTLAASSSVFSSFMSLPSSQWLSNSSPILGAFLYFLADAQVTLAEEEVIQYNSAEGEEAIKNIAGTAYVFLVGLFLTRVLSRRAKRAKEQRVAGEPRAGASQNQAPAMSIFDKLREKLGANKELKREAGPGDTLLGALQAGALAFGLFMFTSKMSTSVSMTELPDGYTARNISITVRTILLGFGWLVTFIFAANCVGLTGLTIQWLLFPDSIKDDEEAAAQRRAAAEAAGPQLPKVSVTSKPDELRRAFEDAERRKGGDTKKKSNGLGRGMGEVEAQPGGLKLAERFNEITGSGSDQSNL